MYFVILEKLFADVDGFCKKPDYAAFKKCFDEDPRVHYFNVTGRQFDDLKMLTGKQSNESKTAAKKSSGKKSSESKRLEIRTK